MNSHNRHIQTFLTVSAAFFAMSAPLLHSNASARTPANAALDTAQHVVTTNGDTSAQSVVRPERDA